MAITRAEMNLRLFDATVLEDSSYISNDKQPFSNLDDLKNYFDEPSNYATLELNQWSLDGSKKIFPDNMNELKFGYWSLSQSDADSNINVAFVIDFLEETHSTIGLTLYFYREHFATNITIKWYDAFGSLIVERTFDNDRSVFFADESVVDYKKIEITFNKTNMPFNYIKLKEIGFGADILFQDTDIKKCTITEELDPTSDELSINTMTSEVYIKDKEYIQSIYKVLQDQQQLIVTEYVNGVSQNMGTFYLTTRSNPNENTIIFNSEDLIGNFSNKRYLGGFINDTFENVIDGLMADYDTTLYSISDELKNLNVSGYIPVTDYRKAIQILAFAVNAVVDCSRSNKINFYKLPTISPQSVDKSRYFTGSTQEELENVTKVDLNIKSYSVNATVVEVYRVIHSAGSFRAIFNRPVANPTITNGTITESNANYIDFTTTGGEVIINANGYDESLQNFSVETPLVPSWKVQKNVAFKNSVVWDGQQNAQHVYDILVNRSQRDFRMVLQNEKVGDFLSVDALYDKIIKGYVESISIDLTGGFIGELKVSGVIE